jgi:hypothetical protein
MNSYLYVLNNRLKYVDLLGLTPSEVAGGGSFASGIVRELEATGQYPGGWGSQELHSFAHRYDEELQWIARHARNASELAFLSDKTLAFEVPLGERIELQRLLNSGAGLGEVENYFAEAVFCLQDRGDWFLGIISWDAYEAYIATRGGSTANQLFGFSLMESSGQMTAMNRWNTNGMIRQRANPSNRLENDLFADSWYGRTRSERNSNNSNTANHYSGTKKPLTNGAEPNSIYTHIHPRTGKAVQNAIYDANGDVIGHVDFKNHGIESGHWHSFPQPGNPGSGHGPNNPHNPYSTLPSGWGILPPGISPHTPIGQ